ncbi:MAG: hypothetical protein M3Q15_04615 [Pseudomonadota bacterium]|nr:hypothetical protein [Pseudomonadota bacterium]
MANVQADIKAAQVNTIPTRLRTQSFFGRIRIFEATYTVPATGGPIVGETISWGQLPVGARTLGNMGKLYFSTGAAASTLNLGDAVSAARHLAATAVTTAGNAVPEAANAAGAQFSTSDSSTAVTNNCDLISTVAGAALVAGQVITLRFPFVND